MHIQWKRLTNGKRAVFELTDGYWTNGQVAIKGGVPLRLRNLSGVEIIKPGVSIASQIPRGHAMEAARVTESDDHVLLVAGDVSARIDPFFHKILKHFIGSFTYMIHDDRTIVLCVNGKGIAGTIMPIAQ